MGNKLLRGGVHSRKQFTHTYDSIISVENLLAAWKEFLNGKRQKIDVLEFQTDLIYQVTSLHRDLKNKTYRHGPYQHFKIADPKPRDIHKASVRDRLLHHALYRKLYPFFEKTFTANSYSCRVGKGTHRAMNRFRSFARKGSHSHTTTIWVLKCDIKKFFASIDHEILLTLLTARITDPSILWLLHEIITSFNAKCWTSDVPHQHKGLPLGNLTSQLFANVYLNELDQFVKHGLKTKYYTRYADDFVFLSCDKAELQQTLQYVRAFLREELKLELHPNKISITTIASGVDFLGWIHFPNHRVLRTSTKRRMFKRVQGLAQESPMTRSYLGLLSHGNAHTLQQRIQGRV